MKLKSLTDSQRARLSEIKDEYIQSFLEYKQINMEVLIPLIKFVYSLIKKEMPKIIIANSPMHGQRIANELCKTKSKYYSFGSYLTIGWASLYAWFDTFVEFGIITQDKFPKYFTLRKIKEAGIYSTIEFDTAIIIIKRPIEIHRQNGRLHSLVGPAILWEDGYCQYYINGRNMPRIIFEKFKSSALTKEMFLSEQNEDIRAGIYELIESKKEGAMLEFLDADEIDRKTINHKNNEHEEFILYKTKQKFNGEEDLNGRSPAPLAWLKMSCPSTGQNYLIPTDGSFSNCLDAAKYHRPEIVPQNLEYAWNQRN